MECCSLILRKRKLILQICYNNKFIIAIYKYNKRTKFRFIIIISNWILFKKNAKDLKPLDCIGIGILTIISLIICSTATDAVIIIFTLLVICILAFLMKWDHILYTSLICMIINIIFLTFEYWSQIPWYVYILIVGLALIVFAMLDEKRKMNKKKKEQEQIDTK